MGRSFILLFLPALFTIAAWAAPLTTTQIAERALPACVSLEVTTADGVVMGSGVLIEASGVILTCYHVIENAKSAVAKMYNGGSFTVQGILGSSREQDLALLQVSGRGLATLPLGDVSVLKPGDKVVAIGGPQGLDHTVSEGIISAMRRVGDLPDSSLKRLLLADGWSEDERLIQFTAPISSGNSGGPLLNAAGEIVGINILRVPLADNIYFAVTATAAAPLLKNATLIPFGKKSAGGTKGTTPQDADDFFGMSEPKSFRDDFRISSRELTFALRWRYLHVDIDSITVTNKLPLFHRGQKGTPAPLVRVTEEPKRGEFLVSPRGLITFSKQDAGKVVTITYTARESRVAILSTINHSGLPAITQAMERALTRRFTEYGFQVVPVNVCLPVINAERLVCDNLADYEIKAFPVPNLAKVCHTLNARYAVAAVCLQASAETRRTVSKNSRGYRTEKIETEVHGTFLLMCFDGRTGQMLFKRVKRGSDSAYVTYMLITQLVDDFLRER